MRTCAFPRTRLKIRTATAALVVLVLITLGCRTTPEYQRIPEAAGPLHLEPPQDRLLRFATPVTLQRTFWKDGTLFLSYSDGHSRYHGKVSAEDRFNLSIHQDWFPVYQVGFMSAKALDAAVELKEPLSAGWHNTFASIIASQL